MLDILYFLKTYSEALTILFTAVVTLSTTVYAWLTYILVKETRKMREAQTEPKIQITIDSFDFAIHIIRLNIENIGLGPAYKIKFESSIISGNDSAENLLNELTESNFFKTGIRYLGPAKTYTLHFQKPIKILKENQHQYYLLRLIMKVPLEKNTQMILLLT